MLKNDSECTNFVIFEKVVHNFGRSDQGLLFSSPWSDDDMI